jgi:hypothetical protein
MSEHQVVLSIGEASPMLGQSEGPEVEQRHIRWSGKAVMNIVSTPFRILAICLRSAYVVESKEFVETSKKSNKDGQKHPSSES